MAFLNEYDDIPYLNSCPPSPESFLPVTEAMLVTEKPRKDRSRASTPPPLSSQLPSTPTERHVVIAVPQVISTDRREGPPFRLNLPDQRIRMADTYAQANLMYDLSEADLAFCATLGGDGGDTPALPPFALRVVLDRLEWLYPSASPDDLPPADAAPTVFANLAAGIYDAPAGAVLCALREHRPPPIAPLINAISVEVFCDIYSHWRSARAAPGATHAPFTHRLAGAPLAPMYRPQPERINDMQPFCPLYECERAHTFKTRRANGLLRAAASQVRHMGTQLLLREQLTALRDLIEDTEYCTAHGIADTELVQRRAALTSRSAETSEALEPDLGGGERQQGEAETAWVGTEDEHRTPGGVKDIVASWGEPCATLLVKGQITTETETEEVMGEVRRSRFGGLYIVGLHETDSEDDGIE